MRKRSPIWSIPKEDMQRLIDESTSFKAIFDALGLTTSGAQYRALYQRTGDIGIDVEFVKAKYEKFRLDYIRGRLDKDAIPIQDIL